MRAIGVSERRACQLLGICRSSVHCPRERADEPHLRARLREFTMQRGGWGSPRLALLLRHEHPRLNHKRVERLYALEWLQVQFRRRKGRKGQPGPRQIAVPTRPLERWSIDFVSAAFASRRRFRVLTIVDDFDRSVPAVRSRNNAHRQVHVIGIEQVFSPPRIPSQNPYVQRRIGSHSSRLSRSCHRPQRAPPHHLRRMHTGTQAGPGPRSKAGHRAREEQGGKARGIGLS